MDDIFVINSTPPQQIWPEDAERNSVSKLPSSLFHRKHTQPQTLKSVFVKSGGWGDGARFCALTKKKHDFFTYSDHVKPGRHDRLEIWNNKRVKPRLTGLNYWVIQSLNQKYVPCYSTELTSQAVSLHFWQVVYKVFLTDSSGSCYYWSINHTWIHANMQTRDNMQQGVDWGSANLTCRSYWDVFDRCDWQL